MKKILNLLNIVVFSILLITNIFLKETFNQIPNHTSKTVTSNITNCYYEKNNTKEYEIFECQVQVTKN